MADIDYETVLADLRRQYDETEVPFSQLQERRATLIKSINGISALLGKSVPASTESTDARKMQPYNLPSRVLDFLAGSLTPRSASDIRIGIGHNDNASVSTALQRLKVKGKVTAVERGRFIIAPGSGKTGWGDAAVKEGIE